MAGRINSERGFAGNKESIGNRLERTFFVARESAFTCRVDGRAKGADFTDMRLLVWAVFLVFLRQASAEVVLQDLQAAIWPVVEQARKTTVAVNANNSTGSGVVVSADGIILTAGHVVTDLSTGKVADQVTILFEDGEEERARVLGMNKTHDAAMLQLIGSGPWEFSPLGSSSDLRPGEWVIATGHPSGYDALRASPVRFGRVIAQHINYFFGSDCVLFGGDSGGPLFDLEGKVIGIHSWIGEDLQINTHAGISGFIDGWESLRQGIREGQLQEPPSMEEGTAVLGVMFDPGRRDVVLDTVLLNSAAEAAGLRAGDVILRVDGRLVNGTSFQRYLRRLEVGDEVVLEVQRGREEFISRANLGGVTSLPFVTERGQEALSQQAGELFQAFNGVVSELGSGVIKIYGGRKALTFGTVWQDGRILAKWSEVQKARVLTGVDSEKREFPLTVEEVFTEDDLVTLRAPEDMALRGIAPSEGRVRSGALIAAVRPDGVAEGIGVLSVEDRSLLESARGFLGVQLDPEYNRGGALIERVTQGSAGEEIGLKKGDVIIAVDNRKIDGLQELKTLLSRAGPEQQVLLNVRRPTGELQLTAKLKPRPSVPRVSSGRERMMNAMDERGLSQRRDSFPLVSQTDMTITPSECGLPVVDQNGALMGVLIARAGRVKTYFLSTERIATLLQ